MNNEKIVKCLERIYQFPDLFRFNIQHNKNVDEYFKTKFNCNHLPASFIEFVSAVDGIIMKDFRVYSITSAGSQIITFEDYSNEEAIKDYCDNLELRSNSNVLFIGEDDMGKKFAIKTDKEDDKIYHLIKNENANLIIYPTFEDLLLDKIEYTIRENI